MRMKCLKLARLSRDFETEHSAYSGVEIYVPAVELRPLETTCAGLDAGDMIRAARVLINYYRQVAPPLAARHGIEYPEGLERVTMARFERLAGPV
jgi:hypothetical protein